EHLLERVFLTLGDRGVLIATQFRAGAVVQCETVNTTGAGDAFIGSFAVFLGEGLSEIDAIKRANLYAALTTASVGTQSRS
ncbi:MAG TPA: PfkB family carbohydrate kinase, partial [Vicinamibacteria bacterium]|nr:PfkB family carbohydrate kinase [Vicinamibacteria bacterium]